MNYGYGLKNKGAGVLPARYDIDRACTSLINATVHKTVIISLATAYLPLKPPSKKIGNEKSDHNRFDQKRYTDTYQVVLFRSVCTILNCLETSYVKWDSNPNMSAS